MSRTIQFKRRTAESLANTIGANGELIIDTTNNTLTIHDGINYGGAKLASETYVNQLVSSSNTVNIQSIIDDANTKMKLYVDSQISELSNNTIYLESLDAANTWLQSNDASTLNTSKTYTDTANNYLKTYINNSVQNKVTSTDLSDVAFSGQYSDLSGTPTNLSSFTNDAGFLETSNLTGYATESYVDNSVANLVNSAPATLDTLKELADALGSDANFSTTIATTLGQKVNSADLSLVATSGDYNDLSNKPNVTNIDETSRNTANAAYEQANTATNTAASAGEYANTAINNSASASLYANIAIHNAASAGEYANTGINLAQEVYDFANALTGGTATDGIAREIAINAYNRANVAIDNVSSASLYANTGINLAQVIFGVTNASFTQANTAINNAASASQYANVGITLSQNVYDATNTAINNAASAGEYANTGINNAASASLYANIAINNAASASLYANTAINNAASVSQYANTGINNAASASLYANIAINNAASAGEYANTGINNAASASLYANTGINNAASAGEYANTAINNATSAGEFANTGILIALSAFDQANTSINNSASASLYANSGITLAQNVFDSSNTSNTWLQANDELTLTTSKSYTDTSIANLVNSAPSTLDTLKELAEALGNDANFSTTIADMVGVARGTANSAYNQANTAINNAASVSQYANTGITLAQAAFDAANNVAPQVQPAFNTANSAYNQTNTAINNAASASLYANTGINNAASASLYANTGITLAQASYDQTNTAINNAASASLYANTGITLAQSAFNTANSSATLSSPTFTGTVTLPIVSETLSTISGATGTVTHNLNTSTIFYHTSVAANFTANVTNVPITTNRVISLTLLIVQGATAYIPNALQINGSAQTIKWADGSAPTGNANSVDLVGFSLINNGGTWTVIGALSKFA